MTTPKTISVKEWAEISQVQEVREGWGLEDETPEIVADMIYGSKFDFVSGCPGYVGDLYTLMGDGLSAPPLVLIRNNNKLEVADF